MKKIIGIISIFYVLFLTSCVSQKIVLGNARVEKRTFDLKDFDSIAFSLPSSEADIIQGEEYKVEISLDSNLFEFIDVSVIQGSKDEKTLAVMQKSNTNIRPYVFKISVTMPALQRLSIGGITKSTVSGFHNKNQSLSLHVGGMSSITADVSAAVIDANISGIGNIDLKTKTEKCSLTISGYGKMTADIIANSINARISGKGNVYLKGNTEKCKAVVSGSGKIKALNLETEDAVCNVSGIGEIDIHAKKSLEARVSGLGTIRYAGNLQQADLHFSGKGRSIKKLNK